LIAEQLHHQRGVDNGCGLESIRDRVERDELQNVGTGLSTGDRARQRPLQAFVIEALQAHRN